LALGDQPSICRISKKCIKFASLLSIGAIAQLVEHRTENPGVPGSIPGGTTAKPRKPPFIFGFSGAFQFMLTVVLMDFDMVDF
jgi:hypothetical protein